jgi:hypothetical protein
MAEGTLGKVNIIKLLMLTHCLLPFWLLVGFLAPLPWLKYLYKHKSQTLRLDLAVGSIAEIVWPTSTGVALVLQSSDTSLRGE